MLLLITNRKLYARFPLVPKSNARRPAPLGKDIRYVFLQYCYWVNNVVIDRNKPTPSSSFLINFVFCLSNRCSISEDNRRLRSAASWYIHWFLPSPIPQSVSPPSSYICISLYESHPHCGISRRTNSSWTSAPHHMSSLLACSTTVVVLAEGRVAASLRKHLSVRLYALTSRQPPCTMHSL